MDEQKSNKVFCINCKYLTINDYIFTFSPPIYACKHYLCFTFTADYIHGELPKRIKDCSDFNKNYDCQYYKRKWWKFWIK